MSPNLVDEAFGRCYPKLVALATTRSPSTRKPNIITLGWWMRTSHRPPMLAISVAHSRYSYELLVKTGEFVLVLPPEEWLDAVLFCGRKSGRNVDKFAETGLREQKAEKVSAPLIKGAIAQFECVVRSIVPAGDHSIFVGEVLAAHTETTANTICILNRKLELGSVRPFKE